MSSVVIVECEQGTPEWYAARRGLPTASEFATILAKGRDGGASVTRRTYMLKLAGEIITEELTESYSNGFMERGKEQEAEARDLYAFINDDPLERVGFVRNGNVGCSPDAFVGGRGVLEIKTAMAHILIGHLIKDDFPPEHRAQTQGALWVCEREWVDLAVYSPKLPLFVKRAYRDEEYIRNLAAAVAQFNEELAAVVESVRRYGEPARAAA
jgi:hypothetical protein